MQEGMFFHALLDQASSSYFEQTAFRLHGELDICLVEKSFNELVNRHDILRTAFIHNDTPRAVQVVLKSRAVDFYYQDISQIGSQGEKEFFITGYKEKDKQRSFDLSKDVLMRVAVFRLSPAEYQFIWSHHHTIMDGWCIGILNTEFFEIYTSYLESRPYRLPGVKPYRNYIQWLEKKDKEESSRYWENYLDSYEEQTGIPRTKTRIITKEENQTGYRNETVSILLDMEKTAGLNKLAARSHVTLNTVAQTLWGILLGKYNDKEDVVFGVVVSGRPSELEGIESMVGLFINTIPVRIRFEGKMKFHRLLNQVQSEALASEPHHYHSLAEIQSRNPLRQNLIDHIFIFENYPIAEQIEGFGKKETKNNIRRLKLENAEIFEQTNYDFNVIMSGADRLKIIFQYNSNVYEKGNIERVAKLFSIAIDQIIENQELEVSQLTFLSAEERNQVLYEFNNTQAEYPKDKTIHQLFVEQAAQTPDYIALHGCMIAWMDGEVGANRHLRICPSPNARNVSLTYRQLNEQSDHLAGLLIEKGVLPDTIVGIIMERSIEMIIGIMGILKSSGAYLPIDSNYPQERIGYMLKDSGAKLLAVANELEGEKVRRWEGEKVLLESIIHHSKHHFFQHSALSIQHSSQLAYVIYTSGTTGRPKGVMIRHRNVVNLVSGLDRTIYRNYPVFGLHVCFVSPYIFDASVKQIFASLLLGHCLYVVPENIRLDGVLLLDYYDRYKIDISDGTPTHLRLFLESMVQSQKESIIRGKHFIIGGEALPVHLMAVFFERLGEKAPKVTNIYGPTECTVDSTLYGIKPGNIKSMLHIPIGSPMPNCNLYIVNRWNNLQPVGIPGELLIGGHGVSVGYLNNPELTAEKFTYLHHSSFLLNGYPRQGGHNSKLYHTGDLARWLTDGNIEFLGRIDQQVKIRGYRIELAEIENRLLNIKEIKEAIVIAKREENGDKYLCAYIAATIQYEIMELREFLLKELPDYMVPSHFVWLEKIPLTPNGKINHKALPEPNLNLSNHYAAPKNEVEMKLVKIWSEVLCRNELQAFQLKTSISIDDNFFHLGGHSLKATVMVSKIDKELNVHVPLAEIFKHPTIRGLSDYIKNMTKEKYASIEPIEKKEYYLLSSAQKRLYILYQMDQQSVGYNIPSFSVLTGEIDKDKFEHTFKQLISRHQSLRTSFHMINDEPAQRIHDKVGFAIEYFATDVHGLTQTLLKNFIRPFDLAEAQLLRVALLKENEARHILMIDMHHIISDGISINIAVKDFMALYQAEDLPNLRVQYKDFSEWQNNEKQKESIKKQEHFWVNEFVG
ncbi:MAG: amino acid adenylation domain-containing protein, partial [Acidobacteria bacterium]|nr:amino acid adenylation domain-containing protein [Acidobacteriota bacterium]